MEPGYGIDIFFPEEELKLLKIIFDPKMQRIYKVVALKKLQALGNYTKVQLKHRIDTYKKLFQ